jgi:glycosyltransferase involved in cell wall biosynthesis
MSELSRNDTFVLEEYKTLRTEIRENLKMRSSILLYLVIIIASVAASSAGSGKYIFLSILFPFMFPLLIWWNSLYISNLLINNYITNVLAPRMPFMRWEPAVSSQRKWKISILLKMHTAPGMTVIYVVLGLAPSAYFAIRERTLLSCTIFCFSGILALVVIRAIFNTPKLLEPLYVAIKEGVMSEDSRSHESSKCAIILPAYNVENEIEEMIRVGLTYATTVIVVDDGSKDRTSDVLKKLEKIYGDKLRCVYKSENSGKADAIRQGIRLIINEKIEADCIVQIDADLAHKPEEIPQIIGKRNRCDMIVANRYNCRDLDEHRKSVVILAKEAIKVFSGYRLEDPMCGFRVYTRELAEKFAERETGEGYGLETEQIAICAMENASVGEYNLMKPEPQEIETKACEFEDVLKAIVKYGREIGMKEEDRVEAEIVLDHVLNRRSVKWSIGAAIVKFNYFDKNDMYRLENE